MILPRFADTLRFKLVAVSLVVQIVFVTLLVVNSVNFLQSSLADQSKIWIQELELLMSSSLGPPLVQQDIEVVQDILDKNIKEQGIIYFVLRDLNNNVFARASIDNESFSGDDYLETELVNDKSPFRNDTKTIISVNGVQYGILYYGVSTKFLADAKNSLFHNGILIGSVGLFISTIIMLITGFWLTRNLRALTVASEEFAAGNLKTRVNVNSGDEVAYLAQAFNVMAESLNERIDDLNTSREKQKHLLDVSQEEKARLTSLLAVMSRGILYETLSSQIIYHNPAFIKMWHLNENVSIRGRLLQDISVKITSQILIDEDKKYILSSQAYSDDNQVYEFEMINGKIIIQKCYPIRSNAGKLLGRLWIFEDVTDERKTAQQLVYLAEHDFLTGLYNRRKFQEEVSAHIILSERNKHKLALLFFDIDDFKYINDVYGHKYGDDLLQQVADNIGKLVRRDEMFCRLGGDEFAVLLPDADIASASRLADRILQAASNIFINVKDKSVKITSSIGVSIFPDHAVEVGELLACADVAMYQAKEAGKNTWRVYQKSHGLSESMRIRVDWENRIVKALDKDLFFLVFQGVFKANSSSIYYYEALVRMRDEADSEKVYYPSQFIDIAERSGKILEIDRWVMRESVKYLAENPNIPCLAINVSGRSFDDPQIARSIIDELEKNNVSPDRLLIEITETATVSDLKDAQRFIKRLHNYGCKVGVDDFGSGYASFLYLKNLDVDIIKIDGMFIQDLADNHDNQVFVKAIVDIARGLNKKVVAEFVENQRSLDLLQSYGVDYFQGYYLTMPQAELDHIA